MRTWHDVLDWGTRTRYRIRTWLRDYADLLGAGAIAVGFAIVASTVGNVDQTEHDLFVTRATAAQVASVVPVEPLPTAPGTATYCPTEGP